MGTPLAKLVSLLLPCFDSQASMKADTIAVDIIDFDITEVIVNTGYALPDAKDRRPFAIITAKEQTCAVTFHKLKDAFKFQHSITGYKVVDYWTS